MRLNEIIIPNVFIKRNVNSLDKKPRKLNKSKYGIGFMPFMMGSGEPSVDSGGSDSGGSMGGGDG